MDIKSLLVEKGIITSDEKIVNESSFREFLLGVFLFYLSFERYKSLFDDAIERQKNSIIKNQKPRPFALPAYPFRFVGIGNLTAFIGKIDRPSELFTEILHPNLFWNYHYIDRVSPALDSTVMANESWKQHTCTKSYLGKYCENCKSDFSKFASAHFNRFAKSLGIHSSIIINLPIEFFSEIVSQGQEGLIELEQEPARCECGEYLENDWICCPYCKQDIAASPLEKDFDRISSSVPEKIFNEALGLYLALKKGYDFKTNYVMDRDFINETDIVLSKGQDMKIVEFTTKLDLDKSYVITKSKNLHIIDGALKTQAERTKITPPNCCLILASINEPPNIGELKAIPTRLFDDEKIKILKSGFKFAPTGNMSISQPELDKLKVAYDNILDQIMGLL